VHRTNVVNDRPSARERWRRLRRDAPRDEYFRVLRDAVVEFYLADPGNQYQQSGRSSEARRWEETRRLFVRALHRDGDLLDVGCANGLLLETLIVWAREEGFVIRPHGIDLVPELVEVQLRAVYELGFDAVRVTLSAGELGPELLAAIQGRNEQT